jgi:hypothetical protein
MLFKAGLVLLISWLLGVFGAYDLGQLVHLQLLIGLACLLLGALRARDAAIRPDSNSKR